MIERSKALAIIAGAGALPIEVAQSAQREGWDVFIVALRGSARLGDFPGFPSTELRIGQLGGMLDVLQRRGISNVAMVGSLTRPALSDLRPDAGMLRRLPRIVQAFRGGDDHLLRRVIGILEDCGLHIVDIRQIASGLLIPSGTITTRKPDRLQLSDGALGLTLLDTLGQYDVGQAAVVIGGRVVAIEGAEGTDGLLERVAGMRANGRIRDRKGTGILVKAAKPDQDMRIDLPTVGPVTIDGCVRAGLAGIVMREDEVIITERERVIASANANGLFLIGMDGNARR